jgi:hypothetical protein
MFTPGEKTWRAGLIPDFSNRRSFRVGLFCSMLEPYLGTESCALTKDNSSILAITSLPGPCTSIVADIRSEGMDRDSAIE